MTIANESEVLERNVSSQAMFSTGHDVLVLKPATRRKWAKILGTSWSHVLETRTSADIARPVRRVMGDELQLVLSFESFRYFANYSNDNALQGSGSRETGTIGSLADVAE